MEATKREHWAAKYKNSPHGSLGYWIWLVACYAAGDEARVREAARVAHETGCGVWHAVSVISGRVETCSCSPCIKARRQRYRVGDDAERCRAYPESLVLCRSDRGDGGWSLHAPGSTDEAIACGDAPPLLTGEAERTESGDWSRPNDADYAEAARRL